MSKRSFSGICAAACAGILAAGLWSNNAYAVPINYGSGPVGASIGPSAGTVTSHTITVPDGFLIGEVFVSLDIEHTWVGDLEITLEHDGDVITLVDRPGVPPGGVGNSANFAQGEIYTFRDGAATGLPETFVSSPIPGGTYLPDPTVGHTFAGLFNGDTVGGNWTLTITDHFNLDGGTLHRWQVSAEAVPEPGTLFLLGSGMLGLSRLRRSRS